MGLDGMRLLTSEDAFEVQVMCEIADRVSQMEAKRMEVQASMIALEVSKMFKK